MFILQLFLNKRQLARIPYFREIIVGFILIIVIYILIFSFLYNYCHFDKLYCTRDTSGISLTGRYKVFINNNSIDIELLLKGFNKGNYIIKEYVVNRINGSAFDNWVEIGAPEYMNYEEVEYLKNKSIPLYRKSRQQIDGEFLVSAVLAPHELQLYEILY